MSNYSTLTAGDGKGLKPHKPRADFPLYPHAVGKWAKTIRGKTFYFGAWDDPEGALQEYLDQRDDLFAGRTPAQKEGLTLRELCNAFIRAKKMKMDSDELSPRTFMGYDVSCRMILSEFGANRCVQDLSPKDFEKLYAALSKKHGLSTLGREIIMVKSLFKYGFESDLIKVPIKFGPTFCAPSKQNRTKEKNKNERINGEKFFSANDIKQLLDAADPQIKAMILLGINGGLGNTDCASLPLSALDLKGSWLNFPRPKTGVARRIPLWPETVQALQEVITKRRKPADDADSDLVFITKYGMRWVRFEIKETKKLGKTSLKSFNDNAIAKAFSKLLHKLELRRAKIGFYALRHSFETIAGNSKDQVAVNSIMGHSDNSMADKYRHGIDDSRLQAVVNHVRTWLFGVSE